jgi:transporter family protein
MPFGQAPWQFWAVLSALFAALTAIFAKIGVENVNSDLATLIRTLVVICVLALIVSVTGQLQDPSKISGRTYLFLLLSGLGTGASWLCYFRALKLGNAAQVAPIDKLSVVIVAILGVVLLGEKLSMVNWLGVLLVAGGAILVRTPLERDGNERVIEPRCRLDTSPSSAKLARLLAMRWSMDRQGIWTLFDSETRRLSNSNCREHAESGLVIAPFANSGSL